MTAPRAKPAPPAEDSRERILEAATALFAERGFHGATTRELAAACGLNIATVHHHVGGKRELYVAVVRRLYEQEAELVRNIEAAMDDATLANPEALSQVLRAQADRWIDLTRSTPTRSRLYMRQWLEDDPDLRAVESELTLQLYRPIRNLLDRAKRAGTISPGIDPGNFIRGLDWMIMGYFVSGAFDWKTLRADPADMRRLKKFKEHVYAYIDGVLGLRDPRSAD